MVQLYTLYGHDMSNICINLIVCNNIYIYISLDIATHFHDVAKHTIDIIMRLMFDPIMASISAPPHGLFSTCIYFTRYCN